MPLRKRLLSFVLIAFSTTLIVAGVASLFNRTADRHSGHEGLYSKIDEFKKQLAECGQQIDWKDAQSIKRGLSDLQRILHLEAPYLDTLTALMKGSLASLRPDDTNRRQDTLRYIAWHKAYLQNLEYQKENSNSPTPFAHSSQPRKIHLFLRVSNPSLAAK
jgi:hypothetical protein